MTRSSGKHLQDNSHALMVSLLHKLLTSSRDSDDLSIGFDSDRNKRQDELSRNKKKTKSKYHLRIRLKNVFGFAEHQGKATLGLGYKLTLTTNIDHATLNKNPDIYDGMIKIGHVHRYLPHFIPSIHQPVILSKQIISKTPTELRYVEGSLFMKEVKNQVF